MPQAVQAFGDRDAPPAGEVPALARLAFRELGAAMGGIGMVHRGIADRVFWALGPTGRVVEIAHGAVSGAVYGALRGSAGALGQAASAALSAHDRAARRAISATPGGAIALGALNGLIGDALEDEHSPLAQPMAVRAGGRPVPCEPEALAAALPGAGPKLAVFLHGLMETEHAWALGAHSTGETYGSRLCADLGFTPVYVRYNTGRHISENGRSLADLMEELVAAWPAEVEQVALIGHSMGGLVSRSATHIAAQERMRWVRRVRHVVSLGTPHMGAPLAQATHVAAAALWRLPETRALAALLRRRSAGIRDLRQGSLVDEDWRGRDPHALRAAACREVPLLPCATHCFVAATVTQSPRHPIARLVGDMLVLVPSASGRSRTRRIPFREEDGALLGGAHHLALLNHPRVYELLRDWLAKEPAAAGEPAALAS